MPKDVERGRVSPQQRPLTVNGKKKGLCGSDVNSGASSESGESHEIKFTQKEGCTPCTCACVFLAISFVALGSAAGIYFGLQFLAQKPLTDRVFKGKLVILEGDKFTEDLLDPNTEEFETKAQFYRSKLDTLYNNSIVKDSYHHSEVITFDHENNKKLVVHFNLHMIPERKDVDTGDLYFVLSEEVMRNQGGVFSKLRIDHQALNIQERKSSLDTISDPWSPRRQYPGSLVGLTTKSPNDGPRLCVPITLDFCENLSYNSTSYPNVVGHKNLEEVNKEVISYRQVIDFECYALTQEFICGLLQPNCVDDKMVPPCRDFCDDFQNACASLLPKEVQDKLNCSKLPQSKDENICTPKPDCAEELRTRGKSRLICDGVVDCPDFSDEMNCAFCKPNDFYCGTRQCVPLSKRCDQTRDCTNGADERGCLHLVPASNNTIEPVSNETHFRFYQKEGFVVAIGAGSANQSKVCLENRNNSMSLARREVMMRHLATTACSELHYKTAELVEIRVDNSTNSTYSKMVEPLTSPVTFEESNCESKSPIFVKCNGLECGKRPGSMQSSLSLRTRPDSVQQAVHGDWPWMASLMTDGHMKCDSVLLNDHWLLVHSDCLHSGSHTNWTVQLGKVRQTSNSPFDQTRTVSRIFQSPDIRSHLSLLKLDHPVNSSDFVRPVCLPTDKSVLEGSICYALAWDNRAQSMLQIQMRIKPSTECSNDYNNYGGICAKPTGILANYSCKDDNPSALFCEMDSKWSVLGFTTASICGQNNVSHVFTKISTHAQWISHIITAIEA